MRQSELFGLSDHLQRLSAHGDPLEELGGIIDFGVFRPVLTSALAYGDGAKGGRPPYDPLALLKVLMLAAQNNVADARMEYLIRDRLSWLRFLGFDLGAATLDANTTARGHVPIGDERGRRRLMALPLDARQHEKFFMTPAQSLFGIALLLRLRLGLAGATSLALLFTVPVSLAFTFRDDETRTIETLTWLGWTYIVRAALITAANLDRLKLFKTGFFGEPRSPLPQRPQ